MSAIRGRGVCHGLARGLAALLPELRLHGGIERREALALSREEVHKLWVRLRDVSDLRLYADSLGRLAGRGHPRQAGGAECRTRLAALHAHHGKAGRGGDHARP